MNTLYIHCFFPLNSLIIGVGGLAGEKNSQGKMPLCLPVWCCQIIRNQLYHRPHVGLILAGKDHYEHGSNFERNQKILSKPGKDIHLMALVSISFFSVFNEIDRNNLCYRILCCNCMYRCPTLKSIIYNKARLNGV